MPSSVKEHRGCARGIDWCKYIQCPWFTGSYVSKNDTDGKATSMCRPVVIPAFYLLLLLSLVYTTIGICIMRFSIYILNYFFIEVGDLVYDEKERKTNSFDMQIVLHQKKRCTFQRPVYVTLAFRSANQIYNLYHAFSGITPYLNLFTLIIHRLQFYTVRASK